MTQHAFKVPLPQTSSDRPSLCCSKCKLTKTIDKSEAETRAWFKKWHFKICDGTPSLVEPAKAGAMLPVPEWLADDVRRTVKQRATDLQHVVEGLDRPYEPRTVNGKTVHFEFPANRRLRQGEIKT